MEEARGQKRAEHEAHVATDLASRYAAKNKEGLAEELMPALRPKLMQGLRSPRVVHHRRPGAGRVAEDGHGEERDQVVHHAESDDESGAREDVYRRRDEVALEDGEVREEDASTEGVADAWDELDGRVDDVQEQKGGEERGECRAEEGLAFLRPRGGRRVYPLAEIPAEAAQREHELERILQP